MKTDAQLKTDVKEVKSKSHEGKVVSIAGDKLTSICGKGHEHHHTVASDAKVTCDGKACKLSDLKAGTAIRMTTCKDDDSKVTAIESVKHLATTAN